MNIVESAHAADTEMLGVTGLGRERRVLYLIQNGGRLYLPVEGGNNFGVILANRADHMVAYPAYIGRDGRRLANIYAGREEDLNGLQGPNELPSNGGMSEAGERGSRHAGAALDRTAIDSIKHPGNEQQKFVAVGEGDGAGFDGLAANQLLIYRRTRPGVTVDMVLGPEPGTRSASAPVIGAAEKTKDGRQLTGLDYQRDATDPIFDVTIIGHTAAASMLADAGLSVPDRWDYDRY